MESNFKFLSTEYPILANLGILAERYIHDDPNTTLFKLRLFGEKMVEMIFEIHQLDFPYENTAFRRLELLKDEAILEDNILGLFHPIRKSGHQAFHAGIQAEESAMRLLFSSFKIAKWFYETYSDEASDISAVKFHPPEKVDLEKDYKNLEQEYLQLEQKFSDLLKEREIGALSVEKSTEIKKRSKKAALKIEMSEAETRQMIDSQLRAAG
jgi:type I restriction enzyme R subunit